MISTVFGAGFTLLLPLATLMPAFLVAVVGSFIMLFVCRAVANRFPVNLAALSVFGFLEGMVMGPALMVYAHVNGPVVIAEAALLAVAIFAMVGTLGYTSTKSYAHWLPWLIGGLFILIIGGILLMFVSSAAGNWLYSVAGALLFIAFTFVDFTRIRNDYGPNDYIVATMQVYLDLINLFWFVLRLLGGGRRN